MKKSLLDRMQWQTELGQILDADRRYVMLRTDVLMGIFRQLPSHLQQEALQAFGRSVQQNGGASAKAYFDSLGQDTALLLDTMQSSSAELGWGVWQFTQIPNTHTLQLTVQNSPFATAYGNSTTPVCYAIAGMLASVGQLVLNGPVTATEVTCAAQGHPFCSFTIQTQTPVC